MVKTRAKQMEMTNVNFDYLKNGLKEKSVSLKDASIELGQNPNYLSNAMARGSIKDSHVKFLSLLYDLDYNELTKVASKETKEYDNESEMVYMDFDYLEKALSEKKVTLKRASVEVGMGSSFLSNRKLLGGTIKPDKAKFLSLLYNLDYDKLVLKKEEPKTTQEVKQDSEAIQALINLTTKLSERVAILESKIEHKDIKITEQEDIILLLNQMLKYGQCQESQFKSKAKSYNFSPELIEFAINELKLERDVSGGVIWLTKPKAKKVIREK